MGAATMTSPEISKPVTAVIVTYQSSSTITPALAAAKCCYEAHLQDVVIIDNGSTDGTPEIVTRESDWATVILTGTNNGFGRGCNIGFEEVSSPYTIFANPDAVIDSDAIIRMVEFLDRNLQVGIVGPAILEGDSGTVRELQGTGRRATPRTILRAALGLVGDDEKIHPIFPGSVPFETGWVCGAALMIRSDLMRQLGGFDPRFFLYWEEVDLCKRAEELGYEVWAVGSAIAHHVGGASSLAGGVKIAGCIASHYFQSRYYYMVKHHGWLAATLAEIGEFVLLALRSLVDAARGRGFGRIQARLHSPLFSFPESS
jgi:N-acetylglucosaminyl-diphospho-decaprenol L-rhamnosyltransferase